MDDTSKQTPTIKRLPPPPGDSSSDDGHETTTTAAAPENAAHKQPTRESEKKIWHTATFTPRHENLTDLPVPLHETKRLRSTNTYRQLVTIYVQAV